MPDIKRTSTTETGILPERSRRTSMRSGLPTVVDRFCAQAAATPDAPAVQCEDRVMTYRELDHRSNQLAHALQKRGVQTETLVPLCIGRSVEMMTGILGILKAGAAWIPIDPGYPADRIAWMLEDSNALLVVCGSTIPQGLPAHTEMLCIEPGGASDLISGEPVTFCGRPLLARHAAYVIYTSGSTGRPKGVVIEHGQIARYTTSVYKSLRLHTCASYGIIGSFAADAVLTAMFAALCYGRLLHIFHRNHIANPHALAAYLKQYPVDCYKITPSLLEIFLQSGNTLLPRKRLIIGGESASWQLVNRVLQHLPAGCRLYNHYGPTETTVGVITRPFPEPAPGLFERIPLGHPIAGVAAHILDDTGQPVPNGETGELYIGGHLLARGYLNRPALTAEKFVRRRLQGKTIRLYRTGDRARCRPDGTIDYQGRTDEQLKIRGYRIEPGEVESALRQCTGVQQCVVAGHPDRGGNLRLVAYVVPAANYQQHVVADALRRQLPAYMIPDTWVTLDQLPLNANSKTDRQSLPDPFTAREMVTGQAAPETTLENELATMWSNLLQTPIAGTDQTFFELGGHSLLLIRLQYQIFERYQVELPPAFLFEDLTIGKLAYFLRDAKATDVKGDERSEGFNETAVTIAQRYLFIRQRMRPGMVFPSSSHISEVSGPLDWQRLETCFQELIQMHESLRTAYVIKNAQVHKRVAAQVSFNIQHVQSSETDIDRAVAGLTMPYDLDQPPLMRAYHIGMANGKQYLYINLPHINSDAASVDIILRELVHRYNGTELAAQPPLQFTDFQKQYHRYERSPQHRADESFWQAQVEDIHPRRLFHPAGGADLPATNAGHTVVLPATKKLADHLSDPRKRQGLSRFQFCLAAYCLFLRRLTGHPEQAVMVPVQNRGRHRFDTIVGLLANTILLRIAMDDRDSIGRYLRQCSKIITEAIRHQQYPYEKVHELLVKKDNRFRRVPACETFFNYHVFESGWRAGKAVLQSHIPLLSREALPLSLAFFESDRGCTVRLSSNAAYYKSAQLQRLAADYFNLLEWLITQPGDARVGELPEENSYLQANDA